MKSLLAPSLEFHQMLSEAQINLALIEIDPSDLGIDGISYPKYLVNFIWRSDANFANRDKTGDGRLKFDEGS